MAVKNKSKIIVVPPPKVVCEVYAKALDVWWNVMKAISTLKKIQAQFIKLKDEIQYGAVHLDFGAIADQILATILQTANSLASQIVGQFAAAASAALKAVLNKIFGLLFELMMSGPQSVLSIVAFPQEIAIKKTKQEYESLSRSIKYWRKLRAAMDLIIDMFGSDDLTARMHEINRHLAAAIKSFNLALNSLTVAISDTTNKSVFNSGAYLSAMSEMKAAIDISVPGGPNGPRIFKPIRDMINAEKAKRLAIKRTDILQWYAARMKGLIGEKNLKMSQALQINNKYSNNSVGFGRLLIVGDGYNAMVQSINIAFQKSSLAVRDARDARLLSADSEAEMEAQHAVLKEMTKLSKKDIRYAIEEYLEFEIWDNYKMIFAEAATAFGQYVQSQMFTIATCNSKVLIDVLRADMIKMIDVIAKEAETIAEHPVTMAMNACEMAYDDISQQINNGSKAILSSSLATSVIAKDHYMLLAAYSATSALINESYLSLMDAGQEARSIFAGFDSYRDRLLEIKDWDGSKGIWANSYLKSTASPYVDMVTSQASLLAITNMPAMNGAINALGDNLMKLMRHNRIVESTLSSYTPPFSDKALALRAALIAVALLEEFAMNFNIANLLSSAVSLDATSSMPTQIGLAECTVAYPELFGDAAMMKKKMSYRLAAQYRNGNDALAGIEKGIEDYEAAQVQAVSVANFIGTHSDN